MFKETKCRTCYVYILDTLADWEIGFITAELNSGRYLDKSKEKLTLIKIGNTLKPIKTMGGIIITPDKDINNIEFKEGDLLVLPGADTWMDENNQKILNIVSDVNNRKHTSNDKDFLKMVCPEYSGSDYYVNQPVVVDDNLITASGLAPLEFSYEVFKRTSIMKKSTLEAWYQLYKTKKAKYYFNLMESIN